MLLLRCAQEETGGSLPRFLLPYVARLGGMGGLRAPDRGEQAYQVHLSFGWAGPAGCSVACWGREQVELGEVALVAEMAPLWCVKASQAGPRCTEA